MLTIMMGSGWLALIMVTMMDDVLGYDDVEDVDDVVELTQSCFELRTAHTLILMILMLMVMLMMMTLLITKMK